MIGSRSVASVPRASSSPPRQAGRSAVRRPFPGVVLLLALSSLMPASASAPRSAGLSARPAGKGGPVPSVSMLARKEVEAFLPFPSQPVTYTITLSNVGTSLQADNPGPEFYDILPPLLTLTSGTASSGTLAVLIGSNTVAWNGSIPGGGSVTITLEAQIVPTAFAGQVVSNQGTMLYDSDANGTNESSVVTDTISAPGRADPTVFTIQSLDTGPGIPTLSAAGLALLALALAGLAVVFLRRCAA